MHEGRRISIQPFIVDNLVKNRMKENQFMPGYLTSHYFHMLFRIVSFLLHEKRFTLLCTFIARYLPIRCSAVTGGGSIGEIKLFQNYFRSLLQLMNISNMFIMSLK